MLPLIYDLFKKRYFSTFRTKASIPQSCVKCDFNCVFFCVLYSIVEGMSVYSHFLHCLWSKLFALRDCWLSEVNRDLKEHIKSKSENVRSNNSKRAGLQEERALCASSAPPERTITYSRFKTTLSAALFCAKTNVSIAAETLILQNWAINNGFGGGTLSHSVSRTRPGGGRGLLAAHIISK